MTTFLLYDDALRSPEVRHEIGEPIMDPVAFIEHDGKRIVIGSPLEESVLSAREDVIDEFWNMFGLGYLDLVKDGSFPQELYGPELVLRAIKKVGATEAIVPPTFAIGVADHLRAAGVEVTVGADAWADRRRKKTPWEIEGIERAQRAADTAMLTAARILREAEPTDGGRHLRFEGEIVTAELVREAMTTELLNQGADTEEILVQSGDACLKTHEPGSGPLLPDQSVVIDCFPRDRRTGVYTDMTRTFVPGIASEDLKTLHKHCRSALEMAFDSLRPGSADAFQKVSDYFDSQGFATYLHHQGDDSLQEGFNHALGHGVGLEAHERPWMGRNSDELRAGDVVAVEPGLYIQGIGGVRLEDTVLVTDTGVEHFTDPFPYDLEP
ncbi:MAG TPA: M24 family metallopeptidase [Actinomycetota bacterium]|nr:M24 family metallopeptidase [Actinomycetota bacterium]